MEPVRIFIASSSELSEERKELILIGNKIKKLFDHLFLEMVEWETDLPSGKCEGERIQDDINKKLEDCQAVIFLFYSRIGKYTRQEYNSSLKLNKKVFLYFKSGFQVRTTDKIDEYRQVLQFKEDIEKENKIIFVEYSSLAELEAKAYMDLSLYLKDKFSAPLSMGSKWLSDAPIKKVSFVGRESDLQKLSRLLKNSPRAVLVNGLPGVGKSEFCKYYFWDNIEHYRYLGWFNYVGSLKESIVNQWNSYFLNLDEEKSMEQKFEKILRFLKRLDKKSLLVIDDLESEADPDIDKILNLPVRVLVSSRIESDNFETFYLDVLSKNSCRELFYRSYLGEKDNNSLNNIIKLAGHHTLTLELLAQTAKSGALSLNDFLQVLKAKGFNLGELIPDTIKTHWRDQKERKKFFEHLLKVFDLSELEKKEIFILTNLCILPTMYLRIHDVRSWLGLESNEGINSLVRKGWLRRTESGILLHQVMSDSIRHQAIPNCRKCQKLINAVSNNLVAEHDDNQRDKKIYVVLGDSISKYLAEENEELATLVRNLGLAYKKLEQLDKADGYITRALKLWEKLLPNDLSNQAALYHILSEINMDLGKNEDALSCAKKELEILEPDHPLLEIARENLEDILRMQSVKIEEKRKY